jgi:hypothetical protein
MTPKEYILVILSGILKAVEKTKWPKKEDFCYHVVNDVGDPSTAFDGLAGKGYD